LKHLFVTNDFPPKLGGIESYLTNLCLGFDPKDITVVAPTRPGWEDADQDLPYKVIRLPGTYLRATRRTYTGLVDAVQSRKPKAVHFLAALPLGRLGPRLAAQTGVGWSVVAHGTGEILLPARVPLARRALRNVLVSADVVFPVSEFTRAEVERITRKKARTHLLPPSVDTDRFSLDVSGFAVRERHGLGSSFVVTFVSRLVKRKGADVLIRAVAGMQGTAALIVGAGPEAASLQRLARESEAADRVVFAGMVTDEQLPSYYAAADVFCMPCTNRYGGLDTEGFGVVYLEAQATGLPCVAGDCGGSAEAVQDGITGIVIEDPTPKTLGEVLVELRRDPARCAQLGGAGRSRMEREFAPAVIAARLDSAMKEALG
jgi:phosphatidylinositol alpha-1,6-mannosyltransferase